MNSTKTAHRRRHHPRITQIKPPTPEFIACLRWMLDFYEFYAISSSEEASYDYADSLIPSSWNNADPQCAGRWSGSAPKRCHDMELAQEDVDTHGIRYAVPWAGEDEGLVSA